MEKFKSIKTDHISYVSSILGCNPESILVVDENIQDYCLSLKLVKFATLNFKDNSKAGIFVDPYGKKFISLKNNEEIEVILSEKEKR